MHFVLIEISACVRPELAQINSGLSDHAVP